MIEIPRIHAAAAALILSSLTLSSLAGRAEAQSMAAWKHNKEIRMNTTAAGADITGAVADFPVAVQLDRTNFDFSQAKDDGSDIRFAKSDGSPLPFEIEHWDKAGQTASLWVKTDVQGNSASQAMVLYWGNAAAAAAEDSKAVFPTSEFIGVWHLGEDGNTAPGGYKEATANQAHGTGINFKPGSAVDARIGKGTLNSNANKTWILVDTTKSPLFNPEKSWTLFIWTRIASFPAGGEYHTMMSKGDGSWTLQRYGANSWGGKKFEPCVKAPSYHMCALSSKGGTENTWYRFAATFTKGSGIKMWINNEVWASINDGSAMQNSALPVGIGNQTQGGRSRWWDGIMDEVRVTATARSENWIKLDYESTREGSKFLTYGTTGTGVVRRSHPEHLAPLEPGTTARYDIQGRLIGNALSPAGRTSLPAPFIRVIRE